MAPTWQQVLAEVGERLDETLLPRLYDVARLTTESIRQDLDERGIARVDPTQPALPPSAEALEASVDRVLRGARRVAGVRGAVAGAGGLWTMPPEAGVALLQLLHLGQRLAVIYGHDPETDKGKVLLLRALAEGLDLKVPRQARMGVRVSDLPRVAEKQLPEVAHGGAWILQVVAARTAVTAASRVVRGVPGLGAGVGAWQAWRATRDRGQRMARVFARAWTAPVFGDGPVEDAVELPLDPDSGLR